MIGVGYYENDEFKYKNFSVNELSFEDEEQIFDEFINLNLEYNYNNVATRLRPQKASAR